MPYNDRAKNAMLDALDESLQIDFVGLHSGDPGQGSSVNAGELTGGSPAYARQGVVWGAAASGVKQNTNAITFDVPAAATITSILLMDAVTAGNYWGYMPLNGGTVRGFGSVDTTLTNDRILSVGHGLADTDRVSFMNVLAETLPTGLTEGTLYFVVNSTTDTFKVSTTSGGSPVDITGLGGGEVYWQKYIPEVIGSQTTLTIAIGALTLDLAAF